MSTTSPGANAAPATGSATRLATAFLTALQHCGLIAILHALYAGLSVAEVGQVDAVAELGRLGLNDHLSSQRSNGLRAMVQRVRAVAAEAAGG